MLRCSRCSHVFPSTDTAPAPARPKRPAPPVPTTPKAKADPLSFSFDDDADWTRETLDLEDIPEEQFSLNLADEPVTEAAPEQRPKRKAESRPQRAPEPPAPPKAAARPRPPKEDPLADMRWDDPTDEADSEVSRTGIRLRTIFIFLILVVSAYAVLARTLYGNPDWGNRLMRSFPPLAGTGNDRLLNRRVQLIDLEARLRRTKEGDDVFFITGNAVNNASVPLRNVEILARLLDKDGNQLQDRIGFCGKTIPDKMLRDLSSQQVTIISGIRPNKSFMIQPGEKAPFVIVFVNPPNAVAEFTTQVVSAQRQA